MKKVDAIKGDRETQISWNVMFNRSPSLQEKRCGGRVMAGGVAYARNKEMLMPMI
jgi:hypothetical protein